jgi:hypothetical protein
MLEVDHPNFPSKCFGEILGINIEEEDRASSNATQPCYKLKYKTPSKEMDGRDKEL